MYLRLASMCLVAAVFIMSCTGKRTADYNAVLATTDEMVRSGALQVAAEEVEKLFRLARGRHEWTRSLKRAHTVSRASDDYGTLLEGARSAHEALPGVEDFSALYVYALLRTGRYDQALRVSREYLKSEKWAGLVDESYFWNLSADDALLDPGEGGMLRNLIDSEDPSDYMKAADFFEDERLILDAALLSMYHGRIDAAYTFLRPLRNSYIEPFMYVAYDTGALEEATDAYVTVLNNSPDNKSELLLFGEDLFYAAGDYPYAYELGFHLVKTDPEYSWIPFVNVSVLLRMSDDIETALRLIETGKGLFPDNRHLSLAHIRATLESGEEDSARNMVEEYRAQFGDDVASLFLAYQLSKGRRSIQRYESLLWEAYLKKPENVQNGQYLAAFLLGIRDLKGLDYLIDVFVRHNGEMEWTHFYNGVLRSVSAEEAEGIAGFKAALNLNQRWETLYNLAVLQIQTRQYGEALENLRKAELMFDWNEDSAPDRALIRLRIAAALHKTGDIDGAIREARYSLDLEPASAEARLLLKTLESSIE